jgi:putative peptidoglycan lipid II flippase
MFQIVSSTAFIYGIILLFVRIAVFPKHFLLNGAIVLALTQFGASLAGLLRDRVLASTFPDLAVVDVYIAAFRPSDFIFQMLIMSAVGTVLVPMIARHHVGDNPKEAEDLIGAAMGMGMTVFGFFAVIIAMLLPWIAPYFVDFTGEKLEWYITFGRIVLLSDFLMIIGNIAGQYLISIEKYWVYGLTPMMYSLATVFGTIFFTPIIGPYGPIVGTASGGLFYALWRLWAIKKSGLHLCLRLWHTDISDMGWLMLPRMVALGALQLELLIFDKFASGLDVGAVTINAYARNFQSVVVGVIGIALAQSVFARISQAAAKKDFDSFWVYIRKSLFLLICLTVPSGIALWILAPFAAWLVALQHVLSVFAFALAFYAISIPFESINHLLLRAFYALHRTDIPAICNVLNVIVAVVVGWMLLPYFGVYALAIGFSLGQIVQMIGLGMMLSRTLK